MDDNLDEALVAEFPQLYRDRHAPMTKTCMCWGFCVGNGWYNLIHTLSASISTHVQESRKRRANCLRYNRALRKAIETQDSTSLQKLVDNHTASKIGLHGMPLEQMVATQKFIKVPDACQKVTVVQVKEKFGGLRFYINGGDTVVDTLIGFAEALSYTICEACGAPAGTQTSKGWIRTECPACANARSQV